MNGKCWDAENLENTDVLASSATYIMHQREEVKKKYLESSVNDCMLTNLFI
jgi:hypothetical protein